MMKTNICPQRNKSILYHLHILDEGYDDADDLFEYPC